MLKLIKLYLNLQYNRWGGTTGTEYACKCRDTRDVGSLPGLGISSGEGDDNHFSILAWTILWTEEPGMYSLWGHRESDMT